MIDLASVTSLQAIDTHGSVVAAADALGFTPSAISQQVKRLERQIGLPLLDRVGRGVILTSHGRHLIEAGDRVLVDLERLESALHREAGHVAGHFRLATFSTATRGLVAPVIRSLLDSHPDLSLTLAEQEPWDTIDLVASGQQDLGIVHSWGDVPLAIPDHLDVTVVAQDVADVIVAADHRLAHRKRLTPKDLVDEGWIATPDGTICRQWLGRMYDGTGRLPRIAHQSTEFDSHLALVAAGLGIALVPRLGRAPLTSSLRAIEIRDPVPTREISILHRRSMADSPAVRAIVSALNPG